MPAAKNFVLKPACCQDDVARLLVVWEPHIGEPLSFCMRAAVIMTDSLSWQTLASRCLHCKVRTRLLGVSGASLLWPSNWALCTSWATHHICQLEQILPRTPGKTQ